MEAETHRATCKTLLAFAIIYFVWGSTFLAIRVGVREVPPFLLAAMRFLIAGLVRYGWMVLNGERSPTGRALGLRAILGILFVLISVGVITTTRTKKPVIRSLVEDAG